MSDANLHIGIHIATNEDIVAFWRLLRNLCHIYGADLTYATMNTADRKGISLPRAVPPVQKEGDHVGTH